MSKEASELSDEFLLEGAAKVMALDGFYSDLKNGFWLPAEEVIWNPLESSSHCFDLLVCLIQKGVTFNVTEERAIISRPDKKRNERYHAEYQCWFFNPMAFSFDGLHREKFMRGIVHTAAVINEEMS